ncbi:MAG: uracil-DNA glycosylase [Smithella sp.]|jgi:hypothetical protein|nr:uracil-DNA glycosylase [Smithella sp.]
MSDKKDHQGTLINCFSCGHFYITYEPKYPYGCKAMGFKSFRMPSVDVHGASGMDCSVFIPKDKDKGRSDHD